MPLSSTAEATDKGAAVVDLNGALGYLLEGCRLIGRSVTQNSRYRLWAVHRRDSCEHERHNESGLVDPVERGLAELIRSIEGFHNHPAPTRPTRKHNGRRQNPSTREEAMSCGIYKKYLPPLGLSRDCTTAGNRPKKRRGRISRKKPASHVLRYWLLIQ